PQGAAAPAATPAAPAAAAAKGGIDLARWKLQLPVDPIDVPTDKLLAGYQDKFFYVDKKDGALVFWCPAADFSTTANTKYPRSELREMLDARDAAVNWGWRGTHVLNLRGAVMEVSPSGKTIVMQIHAVMPDGKNAPPLVKGQFYKNKLDFLVKNSSAGGKDTHYVFDDIELGKPYDAQIKVVDGVLTMTVNGQSKTVDFVAQDAGWKDLKYYFKAGNYLQDRQPSGSTAGALVKIYALDTHHAE
ncbi:MAG: polysaccharide lyase family 7 protein, partial [Rhodocyclaceae bacterium]